MYMSAGSLLIKEHTHVLYDVLLPGVGTRGLAAGSLMIINAILLLLGTVCEVRAKMEGEDVFWTAVDTFL